MNKRNIYINGRFLSQSITGVQRYALELVQALDNIITQGVINITLYNITLITPNNAQYNINLKHIIIKKAGLLKGHIWEQFELPIYASDSLLVNLCNTAPIFKSKQTITIHDASVYGYPQAYSRIFRLLYKTLYGINTARSKRIFTDSTYSRDELKKYCKIPANNVDIISLGHEHIMRITADNSIIERFGLTDKPFVLAVSSMNPNKNFASVVKAIELLAVNGFNVVIAGGTNPRVFGSNGYELPSFVKHVGYVSDAELRALYEHAACFVYPSFYEGFGLPPLEAMSCGCPVLVSNTTSLPEVCDDAALYCDPQRPDDIAAKIKLIMNDDNLRESLRLKGMERARMFTWDKCARETWSAIERVLNENCNYS